MVPLQLMHSVLAGPVQVPHVMSHGAHTPLLLAYLPTGVHEARHLPLSKNGVAAAQDVQSSPVGPEHNSQLVWQATHVSGDEKNVLPRCAAVSSLCCEKCSLV